MDGAKSSVPTNRSTSWGATPHAKERIPVDVEPVLQEVAQTGDHLRKGNRAG